MTVMMTIGLAGLAALMAVESFGIPPLPSEVILPFAGFLIAEGTFGWTGAIAAALIGAVVGSYIGYAIGRWGRRWLTRPGTGRLGVDPHHLETLDAWFHKHGEITVVVGRLIPGVRSYISYPAGTARMEPVRFGIYSFVGALPFTIGLIYAGYVLGSDWPAIVPYFDILDYFVIAGLVILAIYIALRWRGVISAGFPPKRLHADPAGSAKGEQPPSAGGT